MIKFYIFIVGILTILGCQLNNKNLPRSENKFGLIKVIDGVYEKTPDTILYISKISKFQSKFIISNRTYPDLYKNKICFINRRNDTSYLFLIDPKIKKTDSIKLPTNVLGTSWFYDLNEFLVIKDYNKFIVYNSILNRLDSFEKSIESIYIAPDSLMYFIEENDHDFKSMPTYELKYINLKNKALTFLTTIEESSLIEYYQDLKGWSGMDINGNVIFIKTMNSILAIDKTNGRVLDKLTEQLMTDLKSKDKNKVVFYSDKKITFSMKKLKFS